MEKRKQRGKITTMIKDIRCTEINNNPLTTIPEYFEKGWLGGNSLWNFWKNIRAYKKSQGKVREILNAGIVSEESYILAAEDIFLYGRAGMRIWGECVKRYVVAKIRHQIPADSSNMFVYTKGTFHAKMSTIKDRNGKDIIEVEEIKKRWQEDTEELYKKGLNEPDNHDGVVIHLEPDILEYEIKWTLRSIR